MNSKTLGALTSVIILALFGDVICFGLNWLIAKFIGNIIKDRWFDYDSYFKDKKKEAAE